MLDASLNMWVAVLFIVGFVLGFSGVFAYILKGVRKLKEPQEEVKVFLDAVLPGEDKEPPPKQPEKRKKRGKK